ncbi:MAG: hypothetical protein M8349_01290 [ANME-2 cluster archaeon]|nr:hypothetical protein [ANME-2 cluster archaeon]
MADITLMLFIDTVEFINYYVIIPLTVVTFAMLVYFVIFIRKNDPDIIKSKLFLRFDEFRSAFTLLAVAAFVLIFHVLLIYIGNFFDMTTMVSMLLFMSNIQQILGLILTVLLLLFAYRMFRVVK